MKFQTASLRKEQTSEQYGDQSAIDEIDRHFSSIEARRESSNRCFHAGIQSCDRGHSARLLRFIRIGHGCV